MAFHLLPNGAPLPPSQATQPINIESWTEETTASLQGITLSPPTQNQQVTISIPLDETPPPSRTIPSPATPTRKLPRRDSLDRREALQKGKEGSRRRQRWENAHLLSNPWAQPPLPSDFHPHPTHPVNHIPYFLAPLWDTTTHTASPKRATTATAVQERSTHVVVAASLRAKLKHAKASKPLLRDLEETVRAFVAGWEARQRDWDGGESEDEDEEIVFVGRGGSMRGFEGSPGVRVVEEEEDGEAVVVEKSGGKEGEEKLVFDSLVGDRGGSFGRWLVHSIATYYDLRTWSVTVGDPARREAYVGIKCSPSNTVDKARAFGRASSDDVFGPTSGPHGITGAEIVLPRPLWGMV